jgi:drug/metabolite transporter (DMT)-like permease
MTRRAWLLMGVLAATWGASYMFIKVGLRDFGVGMIVCGRTALAALVLLPFALRQNALGQLRGRQGPILACALTQVAVPFVLITVGEHWIESALAAILVASAPIFAALLTIRFDPSNRLAPTGLAGVGVGMIGVALLFGVDLSGDAMALVGGLMVLGAGFLYAAGSMILQRTMSDVAPAAAATASMAVSAVLTAPLIAFDVPSGADWDSVGAVLALGVLGTGLAFLVFYTLIGELGTARASIVAYLAPGFSVGYGVALLGESITAGTIAGLALILVGSWLGANGKLPAAASRSAPSRSTAPAPVRAR